MQLTPYYLFLDYFNCSATLIGIFRVLCGQVITKYLQSVLFLYILFKIFKGFNYTFTLVNWDFNYLCRFLTSLMKRWLITAFYDHIKNFIKAKEISNTLRDLKVTLVRTSESQYEQHKVKCLPESFTRSLWKVQWSWTVC